MIDFIAGLFTGVAVTVTGHPFDTIKVRMQAGEVNSLKDCITKTIQADGYRGFYKGISSPLYSIPIVNAVVFAAYAQANDMFQIESPFWKGIASGSYAGLVNTFVVSPVELVKIKMQVQSNDASLGHGKAYKSVFHCILSVKKEEGVKGLFAGTVATVYREIPGYAAQFASFEASKSFMFSFFEFEELPKICVFVAGMIGGFNCWFWSYPQDVVKTKIQDGVKVKKGWDGGFNAVAKMIWKEKGWRGFWKGFSACFFRATIPNGFGFLANDLVIDTLSKYID